jgi:predicted nuclease of predicted toxin-antitoxin system
MRLLLDNNLSPRLCEMLVREGWDVVHVSAIGLRAALDPEVLRAARDDDRILVSADTDFGGLLAATHEPGPSVVLVRRVANRRVEEMADILVANLPFVADDLDAGCILVIGEDSMRVRPLPM